MALYTSRSHGGVRVHPVLIESADSHNFVAYAGRVFALPQALGPTDLSTEDVTANPDVIIAESLNEAHHRVSWKTIATEQQLRITPMLEIPANVRFYGKNHPAYTPIFSGEYESFEVVAPPQEPKCDSSSLRSM